MRMSSARDAYVRVVVVLRQIRPRAVLLEWGKGVPRGAWIPRSCIHGGDDLALGKATPGSEVTIQIREWIAQREGLIA
jgi:hypothetical protein